MLTQCRFGAVRVVEAAPRPLLSIRKRTKQGAVLCSSSEPLPCRTSDSLHYNVSAACRRPVLSQECSLRANRCAARAGAAMSYNKKRQKQYPVRGFAQIPVLLELPNLAK